MYTLTPFLTISNSKETEGATSLSNVSTACPVFTIERIDFDILLIAVANEKVADEIKEQLIQRGVEAGKIYWSAPQMYQLKENICENC